MIRSTFQILERISDKGEERLWESGILSWDDFIRTECIRGISKESKRYHDRKLREASARLYALDSGYFSSLHGPLVWRIFRFFREDAVFLDIETSGVERHDDITMVGLFDGKETMTMIRGINLDMKALKAELSKYRLVVTFNGSSFDLPFMKKRYPGVIPEVPHMDVRHLCDRVGLNGGLKETERRLGLTRSRIVERMYSGDPYRLWRMYRATGDSYYLNLLVEYNEDDVIHLKTIAETVVRTLEEEWAGRYASIPIVAT